MIWFPLVVNYHSNLSEYYRGQQQINTSEC